MSGQKYSATRTRGGSRAVDVIRILTLGVVLKLGAGQGGVGWEGFAIVKSETRIPHPQCGEEEGGGPRGKKIFAAPEFPLYTIHGHFLNATGSR